MARNDGGLFNIGYFNAMVTAIFEKAIEKLEKTGNPGQVAIIYEFYENGIDEINHLAAQGLIRLPRKRHFQDVAITTLSYDKYQAVSQTIEEIAEELALAVDDSTGGDGQLTKLYMELGVAMFDLTAPSIGGLSRAIRSVNTRRYL